MVYFLRIRSTLLLAIILDKSDNYSSLDVTFLIEAIDNSQIRSADVRCFLDTNLIIDYQ